MYSSELARAWLTAEPLAARLGVPIVAETRLRERNFGIFEGLTLDEIANRHPEVFANGANAMQLGRSTGVKAASS